MAKTASEIKSHIEDKRGDLSTNLRELEKRVKSASDWRCQFEKRPLPFLALALGGGIIFAKLTGSRRGGSRRLDLDRSAKAVASDSGLENRSSASPSRAKDKASQAWQLVQNAVVGIVASHIKDYIEEVLPSFAAHYKKAEEEYRH